MYISKIHIQNYRNYNDFTMNFHKGLNVIIGSNNSGKTGLRKCDSVAENMYCPVKTYITNTRTKNTE